MIDSYPSWGGVASGLLFFGLGEPSEMTFPRELPDFGGLARSSWWNLLCFIDGHDKSRSTWGLQQQKKSLTHIVLSSFSSLHNYAVSQVLCSAGRYWFVRFIWVFGSHSLHTNFGVWPNILFIPLEVKMTIIAKGFVYRLIHKILWHLGTNQV